MRRRDFITGLGGAALLPLAARAQQPTMPVIGFLNSQTPDQNADRLRGFHRGLKEAGFIEGENLAIEYRWADNQLDRLPALAADLVRRRVAVIAAVGGNAPVLAAKAATTAIPVVFGLGEDPVGLGLVTSLARPGGNLTGINFFATELAAKRLEVLRELVPAAIRVAVLVYPARGGAAESTGTDIEAVARSIGMQARLFSASSIREVEEAFAILVRDRPDVLFVAGNPFFRRRRVQLTHLATLHKVPATYATRDYVEVGGLMSYGANLNDALRQMGVYAGRILKGAKPADLPVVQSDKFELVINLQIARILGLTVSPSLLARADEVIE